MNDATAIATRDGSALAPVTADQLDLVKRTIASGATDAELKLFLYDCQRQGVHPLDRLLHFTKRGGKYTPVTSIDLMRIRAAETGEYAGSDDAVFFNDEPPDAATVTVWRLVQGTRCSFTATARWSEYFPGDQSGMMWKKMPHTMLAKCAEALALRKGFPRQLAGLYAKEELDQAGPSGGGYVVEAPAPDSRNSAADVREERVMPLAGRGGDARQLNSHGTRSLDGDRPQGQGARGDDGKSSPATMLAAGSEPAASLPVDLPEGSVVITKIDAGFKGGKVKGFLFHSGMPPLTADGIAIYQDQLFALASELCQTGEPVTLEIHLPPSGKPYVKAIHRVEPVIQIDHSAPLTDSDIPFAWLLPILLPLTAVLGWVIA